MKVEEVPYSAVLEARMRKGMTKYAELFTKLTEMKKEGEGSVSVTVPTKREYYNLQTRIRKIVTKLGGREVFEVDCLSGELRIYVSKKKNNQKKGTDGKN